MEKAEFENYKKAGEIAKEIRKFSEKLIVEGTLLIEIADKIEEKIIYLGGKPAFPVNLSINNVAAHQIPSFQDKTKLKKGDLVKVDFGVHIDGYIVDTAYSVSIGKSDENEKLINAANEAVNSALETAKTGVKVCEIGARISEKMKKYSCQPIQNLSGHMIERFDLHAGITIPNFDNKDETKLVENQVFAIEPFATNGAGFVEDGKPAEIYRLLSDTGNVRMGREILAHIKDEYETLPFAKRWLIKKFGALKVNVAIKELLSKRLIKEYNQLKERTGSKVAQAEHTIIVREKPIILTKP